MTSETHTPGLGRKGSLRAHRFAIEVDLVASGDMATAALVRSLVQLSTAGLMGMVTDVRRVSLNDKLYDAHYPSDEEVREQNEELPLSKLRPPPDARVNAAANELDRVLASLRAVLETSATQDELTDSSEAVA
jgi:hypothetical protein